MEKFKQSKKTAEYYNGVESISEMITEMLEYMTYKNIEKETGISPHTLSTYKNKSCGISVDSSTKIKIAYRKLMTKLYSDNLINKLKLSSTVVSISGKIPQELFDLFMMELGKRNVKKDILFNEIFYQYFKDKIKE